MPEPGDLQKYHGDLGIQRERLQELNGYKFGQKSKDEVLDATVMRDLIFLYQFLPPELQTKAQTWISQVNADQLVNALIEKLGDLVGERGVGDRTIDMSVSPQGDFNSDFSRDALNKMLLEKYRELAKVYGYQLEA